MILTSVGEDLKSRDDFGRSRRPVFIWVFCFFGALAAATTIILLLSGRNWKPIEQTLSDGSILRIEAVTFGTNHVFSKHPVREKIRGILPD